jgi:hypothetical protein
MSDRLIAFFLIILDLDDIEEDKKKEKKEITEDSDYIDDDFEYISNTDTESEK